MYTLYKKEYHYGRPPVWVPLTDEQSRPVKVATLEEAARYVTQLRAQVHLREGEYAAPRYGAKAEGCGQLFTLELEIPPRLEED